MTNYPFVHISQRAALGTELLQKLNDKQCNPDKVMFTLRKNGKSGVSLRKLISTDPIRYQNYALANDFSRGITEIGSGVYGKVFLGCLDQLCKKEIAIKKGKCVIGDLEKEYRIIKMIEGLSPNTPIAYSLFNCGRGDCILYLEYIPGGTLYSWLLENRQRLTREHLRNIVFQILYTIKRIQEVYPSFRHNDLKLDNVLVNDRASASGYVKYGNKYVPNIGVQAIMSDFGMSNIDNLMNKTFRNQPQWRTNYGIAKDNIKLYDVHYFLNNLDFLNLQDPEFNQFLRDIFPQEYLGIKSPKIINRRLRYGVDHSRLPSLTQILNHPYFDSYSTKRTNVVYAVNKKYNINNLLALRPQQPPKLNIAFPPNYSQIIKPGSRKPVAAAPKPVVHRPVEMLSPGRIVMHENNLPTLPPRRPLLSPTLPTLPPLPNPNRNRVLKAKTLKNLKSIASNRKIPGRGAFKLKAQMENLRRFILENINKE